MKLSVVLATFNEADNLADCLKSVKGLADEIIVVDGQSTDQTRDIAQKYGAKVYLEKNRAMFHTNKQIALDKAQYSWILQLDADERVDKKLKQAIKQVVLNQADAEINGYFVKRKNFFLGQWLKKGGQYPDPVIRLVKKGKAHFPQKSVHEQISVKGKISTLKGHLLHYTAPTLRRYLTNSNRYTSLTVKKFQKQNIPLNGLSFFKYICLKPTATFINLYFRHKGFMDGFAGFSFALFSAFHWSIAYLKYWELKKGR